MFDFADLDTACLDVFGQPVGYQHYGGSLESVTGIVSPGNMLENVAPGSGTYVVLFLRVADLASAPKERDTVTIGSATYTVFRVELDAAGGAHLAMRVS